jgi:hypothetical protein
MACLRVIYLEMYFSTFFLFMVYFLSEISALAISCQHLIKQRLASICGTLICGTLCDVVNAEDRQVFRVVVFLSVVGHFLIM